MKKALIAASGLIAGMVLMVCSSSAMAHGRVDWSVSIGAPIYAAPPVVYAAPPVVYEYEEPAPVVYRVPAPVVRYQPYYAYPDYGYRDPYWRRHEWREHEWREHEWREHHRHHDHDRD